MFMANGQLDYRQEETEMIQENTEEEDSQKGDTREVFLSNNSSNERERSNTFPFNGTISPRSVNGRQYTQMNSTIKEIDLSNQPKGIYLVKVTAGNKVSYNKITYQ